MKSLKSMKSMKNAGNYHSVEHTNDRPLPSTSQLQPAGSCDAKTQKRKKLRLAFCRRFVVRGKPAFVSHQVNSHTAHLPLSRVIMIAPLFGLLPCFQIYHFMV